MGGAYPSKVTFRPCVMVAKTAVRMRVKGTAAWEFFFLNEWGFRLGLTDVLHPLLTSVYCPFNLLWAFQDGAHRSKTLHDPVRHSCVVHACLRPVLWIRNDLFRIQLWIFRVPDPDPGKSSGSMRIRIHNTVSMYSPLSVIHVLTAPPPPRP